MGTLIIVFCSVRLCGWGSSSQRQSPLCKAKDPKRVMNQTGPSPNNIMVAPCKYFPYSASFCPGKDKCPPDICSYPDKYQTGHLSFFRQMSPGYMAHPYKCVPRQMVPGQMSQQPTFNRTEWNNNCKISYEVYYHRSNLLKTVLCVRK